MHSGATIHELKTLVLSYHPAISIDTAEESRVQSLVETTASELDLPLFTWSVTRGLAKSPSRHALLATTNAPLNALRHIEELTLEGVFLLLDFARHLEDAVVARQFRELLAKFERTSSCFVITGSPIHLPQEIMHSVVPYELKPPCRDELVTMIESTLLSIGRDQTINVAMDTREREQLVVALGGMTLNQARQSVASAMIEDGRLDVSDIARLHRRKATLIRDSGLLEYFPVEDNGFELGGFENLKQWLDRAATGFTPEAASLNLSPPGGVLIVGVQGCGKSLAAKAIARQWGLPLLKLDAGNLYDKYIGESERNLRKSIKLAESLAPVVLWIDEIEKAFGGAGGMAGESDGGTSLRVLATFLTWLQEKDSKVFVVGTANNLDRLPPELLRKGRFDEIFFVDLPLPEEREEILRIHLELHGQAPEDFDIPRLVETSEGFSGAEIEQAVIAGLYRSLHRRRPLDTDLLLDEMMQTFPLSVSRREEIASLREYARGRFVRVSGQQEPAPASSNDTKTLARAI